MVSPSWPRGRYARSPHHAWFRCHMDCTAHHSSLSVWVILALLLSPCRYPNEDEIDLGKLTDVQITQVDSSCL